MGEILTEEEVYNLRHCSAIRHSVADCSGLFTSHESLRSRVAKLEKERDDRTVKPLAGWPKFFINGLLYQSEDGGKLTQINSSGHTCPECGKQTFHYDPRACALLCYSGVCHATEGVIYEHKAAAELLARIGELESQLAAVTKERDDLISKRQVQCEFTLDLCKKFDEANAQAAAIFKCSHCGNPATCHGTYEDHYGFGCDECCGHGCEDGHCDRIDTAGRELLEECARDKRDLEVALSALAACEYQYNPRDIARTTLAKLKRETLNLKPRTTGS